MMLKHMRQFYLTFQNGYALRSELSWTHYRSLMRVENEKARNFYLEEALVVREITGLDMNAAKEAFSEYLTNTSLDSGQIYFVNQIVEYIVHNGMMKDLSVLQEPPFTDQGSITEIFTDMAIWQGIRRAIEKVNRNVAA